MRLEPRQPSAKGPANMFTGCLVRSHRRTEPAPSRMRAYSVHFAPGARTAWHVHAVGTHGGEVIEMRPGDTVYTPPGEWHWHGAAPDNLMTHLAMWEAPEEGVESERGDLVTDEEYGSRT